jgi:DNA-binding Lrp family transcriptional regulator
MKGVDSSDPEEFQQEKMAAKNRIKKITVRDVSMHSITRNGKKLAEGDLSMLGAIVEEEHKLDKQLGVYIDGVSRSHLADLLGYKDSGSARYRLKKLEEAGVIATQKADDLPEMPQGGAAPVYAMPTSSGRRVVDELDLLPVLMRDRDTEQVVDQLLAEIEVLHRTVLEVAGKQAQVVKSLDEQGLDFPHLSMDNSIQDGLNTTDLEEEPLSAQSRADDVIMADMDAAEREMVISRLIEGSINKGE